MRLGGGPPGELGGPLEGGDPQGPAPLGLGVQDHEAPGNGLDVRSAVGDGVAPDLRKAQLASGEHGGPAGHGLQDRQAEALTDGGIGQDLAAGQESGQVLQGQVAGPQDVQVPGHLSQGGLNVLVPPGSAGQDQGRGVLAVTEDVDPGAHQVGNVLAGLQGSQEADVAPALQSEGGGHAGPFGVVDRVEHGGVHAVVGDVEALGVASDVLDGLVASGL